MNRKRIFAIGKLVLLFGTPLAVILGLFSCGVYCGSQHRVGITSFERNWLGLDVQVPGELAPAAETKAAETKAAETKAAETKAAETKAAETKVAETKVVTEPPVVVEPPPVVVEPPATGGVPAPLPPPVARVDPLEEGLAARLRVPVVARVKVLVDQSLVDEHPDWIDYVQRTVSRASQVYEQQFGITLELAGVARWSVAPEGMGSAELLEELRGHPREGADLVLGFTSRPFDAEAAEPSGLGEAWNGAQGVVYATPGHREAHLRTLLHEVARLYGATVVVDPADPAYVAGSWMSYASVPETQAPWIDAANRQRILERKDLPFAPEAPPAPVQDDGVDGR